MTKRRGPIQSAFQSVQLGAIALTLTGCFLANAPEENPAEAATSANNNCPSEGAALQVLGSGGPIAEAGRAGTSYLLWMDGQPRLLIDAGAGSFLRFAEAGASVAPLDAILLTHLHADHVGDLAGILNSGGFEGRSDSLPIIGPDSAERFPGTTEFLRRLISKDAGAFAYNGGFLDGTENKPHLSPRDIVTDQGSAAPAGLDVSDAYSVLAHPVNHAAAPALGYVVELSAEYGGARFVITGDQSAFSQRFAADNAGTNPAILFAHHVINGEPGQPRGLHRTPAEIGQLAAGLGAQQLVLTHNMERSISRIDDSRTAIAESYDGPVSVATDLECYPL